MTNNNARPYKIAPGTLKTINEIRGLDNFVARLYLDRKTGEVWARQYQGNWHIRYNDANIMHIRNFPDWGPKITKADVLEICKIEEEMRETWEENIKIGAAKLSEEDYKVWCIKPPTR